MKKCVVIYNPNSGKKNKDIFLKQYKQILENNDYEVTTFFTKYHGHAIEIVENLDNPDLVISVGGDGTFNEVMTGNFKRKKKVLLAHIPLGTTNDIGSMFGYTKNPISNLKLIMNSGVVKKIDICTLNGEPFVYVAGFGKFMNVPYETSRDLKKKYGYLAYILEGAKSFRAKTNLYDITYEIDGEVYRGLYSFMIASNANRIAGVNNFFKDIKLDDDRFEVLFCNLSTKKDIIKSLYYLKMHDITKVPGFYFHKTNNLKITFNDLNRKKWCIDGEKYEENTNTFDIRVVSGIQIMLPNKKIDTLFINK